jgi:hypothetical protein
VPQNAGTRARAIVTARSWNASTHRPCIPQSRDSLVSAWRSVRACAVSSASSWGR